jgi:hypothetical protein
MTKKIKISFAPQCFDEFDGDQEELDELISEIQKYINSEEFVEFLQDATGEDDVEAELSSTPSKKDKRVLH